MATLLTIALLEGVLIYTVNKIKVAESDVVQKWCQGDLSYEEVLLLKQYTRFLLQKVNRKISFGKHPGLFKKEQ